MKTVAVILVLLLAGCGGSTPAPPVCVCPASRIPLSSAGGQIPIAAISTFSGTLTYPANNAPSDTTLSAAATTQTGTPLPNGWDSLWLNNPLVSYIFISSKTVTFNGPLTLAVNMGSHLPAATSGPGMLEIDVTGFDLTAQSQYFEASAFQSNISGTTVTFSLVTFSGSPFTFVANHIYQAVLNYSYSEP